MVGKEGMGVEEVKRMVKEITRSKCEGFTYVCKHM